MNTLLRLIQISLTVAVCLAVNPAAAVYDLDQDYRREMRELIENLSSYARDQKPDFVIIVRNALSLLIKQTTSNVVNAEPAHSYMRSIDGVLQEGVWFGVPKVDQPIDKDRTEAILTLLGLAKDNGLKVMVQDNVTSDKTTRTVLGQVDKLGFVADLAPTGGTGSAPRSDFRRRPHKENAGSVTSLEQIQNFREISDSSRFGREDRFSLVMRETNDDLLITDVYHGRKPLTKAAVAALKFKQAGGKRLVLSRLDVSKANVAAYYWDKSWQTGNPPWIDEVQRKNSRLYHVKYWDPAWQSILYGNTRSYIYGLIDLGFDGVVLDGVDGYKYFEGDWFLPPM